MVKILTQIDNSRFTTKNNIELAKKVASMPKPIFSSSIGNNLDKTNFLAYGSKFGKN